MRKVTYSAAVSLDLYIAGPDEAIDWLTWTDETRAIMKTLWQGVDTVLMGRRTWEFAQRSGGGASSGCRTYVFSRTMKEAPKAAELVREDAAGFVRALKEQAGGAMFLMGGGELASALLEAGLVDEISMSVHPLLLGGGAPMFRPIRRRVAFEPVEAREIGKGCVYLRYRVAEG